MNIVQERLNIYPHSYIHEAITSQKNPLTSLKLQPKSVEITADCLMGMACSKSSAHEVDKINKSRLCEAHS